MSRRILIAVVGGLLLCGTGLAWALFAWTAKDSTSVKTAPDLNPVVKGQGDISGLYRGAIRPYEVTLTNPNQFPIRITSLIGYNPKTREGCQDYSIRLVKDKDPWKDLIIPGKKTVKIDTKIEMRDWAKPACSGRTLPFIVKVTGTQAPKK